MDWMQRSTAVSRGGAVVGSRGVPDLGTIHNGCMFVQGMLRFLGADGLT